MKTTIYLEAEVDRAVDRLDRRDVRVAPVLNWWSGAPAQRAEIAERYEEFCIGLTDASLVAFSDRLETVRIATLDERRFRAVRPLSGGEIFVLLPSGARS